MKRLSIPPEFRDLYKWAVYTVYDTITVDVPEMENYPLAQKVEIIRDANRISTLGLQGMGRSTGMCVAVTRDGRVYRGGADTEVQVQAFKEWLKSHEYDPAFADDMNRAVREILTGK